MDVENVPSHLSYMRKRAIVPLIDIDLKDSTLPDLENVQGDVIYVFPKDAENFLFFRIHDVPAFKTALKSFKFSSSKQVQELLIQIGQEKHRAGGTPDKPVEYEGYQIAFTRMGMNFLGVKQDTGDTRFDTRCMGDDKSLLDDQRDWDPIFHRENVDPEKGSVHDDVGALHGIITIVAHNRQRCNEATTKVFGAFGQSTEIKGVLEGRARPDENRGHEHFGYKDGISQPAIRKLVQPHKGQIQVDPGVIIMGYPGDPVLDNPETQNKRPDWTKDGTMLVFRKLEQDVLLWNDFVGKNGPRWPEFIPEGYGDRLTDEQGCELFGARLVGRWKSGAPLAKCPYRDNTDVAKDKNQNNDFDYTVPGAVGPSDKYCPFVIHTRKTAPRNLDPYIARKYLESGSIVRAGLPYGEEVTDAEREDFKNNPKSYKQEPRGLLFNCYAASLDQGFIRQTIGYAINDYFPITSLVPTKHGQDPILGSPPPTSQATGTICIIKVNQSGKVVTNNVDDEFEFSGILKPKSKSAIEPPGANSPFFVTSRGGEYFFVPSISTITAWAGS